jgi:hypothetical protein
VYPFNIVLIANIFLVLLSVYVFESDFVDVLIEIRDVFEMTDTDYYSFFGTMLGVVYVVSPFKHDSSDRRIYIFNRLVFLTLVALNVIVINAVGIEPVALSFSLRSAVYVSGLLLIGAVHTIGGYFLFWAAVVFVYFLGYRIRDFDVRLDATKSPENLGLERYGTFIFKILTIPFIALVITGWTGFIRPNVMIYLLTICGSVLIPLAFVGSQYGLHIAIQRAKEERLQDLRDSYAADIDMYFSSASSGNTVNETSDVRINSMLSVKNEIDKLPEWPANIQRLKQIGIGLLIPNFPIILNVLELVV